eukprot:1157924-Pelagomonas_calceolata.AAC.15
MTLALTRMRLQVEEVQLALEQLAQAKATAIMEANDAQQASQEALAFTNEKFATVQVGSARCARKSRDGWSGCSPTASSTAASKLILSLRPCDSAAPSP